MSISLLSLFVGHDGHATMGLNLRLLGFGISLYSDFCVSTAFFFFYLFGLVNFLQSVEVTSYWDIIC